MSCVFRYELKDLLVSLPAGTEFELESQAVGAITNNIANVGETNNSNPDPVPVPVPENPDPEEANKAIIDCDNNKKLKDDLRLGSTCCGEHLASNGKKLDFLLCQFWDEAQEKGLFRYKYQKLPSKVIPGRFKFFAQLNTDRAEKRRKPQIIQTVNQSFDPHQFNFNKVQPDEIILQLKPWWSCNEMKKPDSSSVEIDDLVNNDATTTTTTDNSFVNNDHRNFHCASSSKPALGLGLSCSHDDLLNPEESDHKILINASPLEYGNVLIVPFLRSNLPQIITQEALRIAVEMVLLSRSRNYRSGFNSLCAYASVNHCHFHSYYLPHRLYLEHADLKQVKGRCMEFCDYPAPGFVFLLTAADLENEQQLSSFIEQVFRLISFLQVNELPHNLFMTRGGAGNSSLSSSEGRLTTPENNCDLVEPFDAIRIFVWARSPSFGAKVCNAFNPALCELAGHIPIKTEENYEKITEEFIVQELTEITSNSYTQIRNQVIELYS